MKTSILVGITAIMLLFCCTLPAAASDYTLGVFGNANEDETINMQDVTYTELIILEYRDQTELSDAKYDGKINMQDVTQIELVILGKEKELTIVDTADRIVTVNKPVEHTAVFNSNIAESMRALDAKDKIAGIAKPVDEMQVYFPEISKLPTVGDWMTPDIEAMLSLDGGPPDVVFAYVSWPTPDLLEDKLAGTDVTVIRLEFYKAEILTEEMELLGYIFGQREEADEYISFHDEYVDIIKERVAEIPEDDKPTVYLEISDYKAVTGDAGGHQLCVMPGGINVFADLGGGGYVTIDPEDVIAADPDVILRQTYVDSGYDEDDPTEIIALRDSILNRMVLSEVTAVTNGDVFVISNEFAFGPDSVASLACIAKWFHPDLFEDLDPHAIHQEYLTEFQGLDYDLDEHGVFVYPQP